MQVTIKRTQASDPTPKLTDHMEDPHGIFKHALFSPSQAEGEPAWQRITITTALLEWTQKEAMFKLPIAEKIERITFLKGVSSQLFKAQKFDKASKIYDRIN